MPRTTWPGPKDNKRCRELGEGAWGDHRICLWISPKAQGHKTREV